MSKWKKDALELLKSGLEDGRKKKMDREKDTLKNEVHELYAQIGELTSEVPHKFYIFFNECVIKCAFRCLFAVFLPLTVEIRAYGNQNAIAVFRIAECNI